MTKQRRAHRVPISDETAAIVRQRLMLVPKGVPWLFPGDTPGQPVQEVRRFWARVQKDCGLEDVRIHDLRHTFASLLVSGGASLEMIGKLLGHSQMQTTLRYAHLWIRPCAPGSMPWPAPSSRSPGWCMMPARQKIGDLPDPSRFGGDRHASSRRSAFQTGVTRRRMLRPSGIRSPSV